MKEVLIKIYNLMYKQFSFIESNNEKFKNIIFENLENKISNTNIKEKEILRHCNENLYKYLYKLLNKEKLIEIINNYIISNNGILSLRKLEKFFLYIRNSSYEITYEEYIEILNIKEVDILIKNLVETNINSVKNKEYEFVSNNLLIPLIDIYCDINDIEFNDLTLEQDYIDNINSDDSITIYLKQMGSIPQLTEEETRTLFEQYYNGDLNAYKKLALKLNLNNGEFTDDTIDTVKSLIENSNLTKDEKEVIIYRFGLDGKLPKTLEDIGKILSVTRERIRQIETKALFKLNPEEGEVMPKNPKTFYEQFNKYSKDQVDEAFKELSVNCQEVLKKRYGENLNEKTSTKLTQSEFSLSNYAHKRLEKIIIQNTKVIVQKAKEINKTQVMNEALIESKQIESNNISKEEYIKILDIFNSDEFKEMIKTKDPLECTVLTLVLGHIEGKYFLTPSIANFLGIEQEQINNIVKSGILELKEMLNKKIDIAIATVQNENSKQYVKSLGGK